MPRRLPEITLPGPTVLLGEKMDTPSYALPRTCSPEDVVPIRLWETMLLVPVGPVVLVRAWPVMKTPAPPLSAIVLPRLEELPPTTFCDPSSIRTPSPALPGLPVPNL